MTRIQPCVRIGLIATICLLVSAALPSDLPAQYFGQNKVRYETFDFKVLETAHFDIHYYDEEAETVREFGRMAERWYTRLSSILDHRLSPDQPIIVYASHPAFRGTSVIPDLIGETTGGVTEGLRQRLIMPLAGPLKETDHVLGHELVHAFQFDMTRQGNLPGAALLPLWFVEGMAEYLSLGPVDSHTAMWMRDAVRRNELPDLEDLDNPKYFPYRYGHAFWAYIGGRYGDDVIGPLLMSAAQTGDLGAALRRVLQIEPAALSKEWQSALRQVNEPILRGTQPSGEYGSTLVEGKEGRGEINVAPALSPDGAHVVYFSERDLFSIDLFLADARTGEVRDKITESVLDAHIDSLQFVNSAGDWSRDGRLFAFGSVRNGRPEVSIYNFEKRNVERRIRLASLGEVHNLTWAPDGQSVAFSGMTGGVTDLFLLDLQTENVRQLTNDAFADLHPDWSPDGSRIVFVTDRFSTDLAALDFGNYRLALLDPATGRVERAGGFDEGKHINPQWAADGRSIYFISDRDGISNIYRLSRADGSISQVTNVQTGISGITDLSPAMSVASNAMVFSTFSGNTYSLRRIDGDAPGRALSRDIVALNAARLSAGTSGEVAALLGNSREGLASAQDFASRDYHASLSLDYIAPPSVAVGVSNFGSMVGGGTTLGFSDLLGGHNLSTTLQTSFSTEGGNFLNSFAALAGYENQRSRWTWGFAGGQVPFMSGDFSRATGTVGGTPVVVDNTVRFWQVNRELLGYLAYPFNRAQRVEFTTGYRHISFDAEEQTEVFNLVTGQQIAEQTQDIPSPDSLNLVTGAAALVFDTSIFGGTSPVTGRRYRFEAGGSGGDLRYGSLLGDFRQYFQLARSLTVAGRVLHFGRYGGDSEDPRLQDLFLGNESLVRGYSVNSFNVSECGTVFTVAGTCPVFDQLFGSRMAVANAEVRVPILGPLGVIPSRGFLPVETALFYDAGVAWTASDEASFLGGARKPVTSYGGSLRFNILGFAIGQISLVHPNDRPEKGWIWEFALLPGF